MTTVRRLNEAGISRFRDYIARVSAGEALAAPQHLLTDPETSEPLQGYAEVENVQFVNKHAAAVYLSEALQSLERSEVDHNVGLWSWLSLFYFDQVCPAGAAGQRKPGEEVRHILSAHAHKYYRHLLAGPFNLLRAHGDNARIFLCLPLTKHGDFSEQLASRMELISNKGLIEAVDRLYFTPAADGIGSPKRGAATRNKPGTLRRLVDVIQQFDLTYDLYAMNPAQILSLLPQEFNRWRKAGK